MNGASSSQIIRRVAEGVLSSLVIASVFGMLLLWKTSVARGDVERIVEQRLPARKLEGIENRLGSLAVEQARQGAILERIDKRLK